MEGVPSRDLRDLLDYPEPTFTRSIRRKHKLPVRNVRPKDGASGRDESSRKRHKISDSSSGSNRANATVDSEIPSLKEPQPVVSEEVVRKLCGENSAVEPASVCVIPNNHRPVASSEDSRIVSVVENIERKLSEMTNAISALERRIGDIPSRTDSSEMMSKCIGTVSNIMNLALVNMRETFFFEEGRRAELLTCEYPHADVIQNPVDYVPVSSELSPLPCSQNPVGDDTEFVVPPHDQPPPPPPPPSSPPPPPQQVIAEIDGINIDDIGDVVLPDIFIPEEYSSLGVLHQEDVAPSLLVSSPPLPPSSVPPSTAPNDVEFVRSHEIEHFPPESTKNEVPARGGGRRKKIGGWNEPITAMDVSRRLLSGTAKRSPYVNHSSTRGGSKLGRLSGEENKESR